MRPAAAFKSEAARQQLLSYIRIGLPVLMLVVAFVFFRLLIRSVNRRAVRGYDMSPDGLGYAANGALAGLSSEAAGALRALPAPEEIKRSELEVSVHRMAHSNPETVAEVVQSWLREE